MEKYLTVCDVSDYIEECNDSKFNNFSVVEIFRNQIAITVHGEVYKFSPKEFILKFGDEEMDAENAKIVNYFEGEVGVGLIDEPDYRIYVPIFED